MNLPQLTTPEIIAIAFALLIIVGIVVYFASQKRRSARLREQFGPEYERAVAEGGDRRGAEAKLAERADRVRSFNLRPLTAADRATFAESWNRVQARFVDDPSASVADADRLLGEVMAARGYPVADFEQRAADISVDHPKVVQNYRTAHDIALRHVKEEASTEDLRKAMIHYRALFEDLVSDSTTAAPNISPDSGVERERATTSRPKSRDAVA